MDNISVSVSCLVYNHEKYLRQCLEGILCQKTNFKFELLIHDDASTDGSAAIIREFEQKYPEIVRPIYQTENQHSQKVNIHFAHQYPRARGKYFALCEGDDFWADENKLQKQFDLMEAHPECSICVHTVLGTNEDGAENGEAFPPEPLPQVVCSGKEMVERILSGKSYPFQTSSYFYVSKYYTELKEVPTFMQKAISGDVCRLLYLGDAGDIAFIDAPMSRYRMNCAGSWSSRMRKDLSYRIKNNRNFIEVLKDFDAYSEGRYASLIAADIQRREFLILKNQMDVKTMKAAEYRPLFKKMSLPERVCFNIAYYLPFTKGAVRRLREYMISR